MSTDQRDALLAVLVLATLVGLLGVRTDIDALGQPLPAIGGVAGALLVELAFLRSRVVARAWERPVVQAGGAIAVVAGGLAGAVIAGTAILAALCWGIATYFVLLGTVLVLGHNPLAATK